MMRFLRVVIALLAAAAALVPAAPAAAAVSLTARLVDFTPWLSPEGTARAVLEVTNNGSDPATRLQVSLQIHEGVDTRSELERSFAGSLGSVVGSDTLPIEVTIAPRSTEVIAVEKPLSEIRFFSASPDDRAYPVRMVVRSGRVAAPAVDTHMVFFSRPAAVPLGLVLVVPLHAPVVYNPDMQVVPGAIERSILDGRLDVILDAVEAHSETRLALAPSGLLLDMLADLADGYPLLGATGATDEGRDAPAAQEAARLLERIRTLAARPTVALVASPYAQSNLVWLSESGLADRAQAQVGETRLRIRELLAADTEWLLPPMGAINEEVLSLLQRSGVSKVILAPSVLPRSRGVLTRAAPVEVRTRSAAPVPALVTDGGLDSRLRPTTEISPTQARQRFLAETATIMLERPSEKRVAVAAAPNSWAPAEALVEGLLLALGGAPWIRGITPEEAFEVETGGRVELLGSETVLAAGPRPPPAAYVDGLRGARTSMEQYTDLGPPAPRIRALERNLMIAESSDWWGSRRLERRGLSFAESVEEKVREEFSKIRAPAPQTITLTSRTGVIPLVVSTRTDYPVRVVIRLDSAKLRFPNGTEIASALEPPAQTIRVSAVAEASGTFPVRVVVETPNRGVELSSSRLVVRSTAYNVVAVAITIGAGVFMVFGWVTGAIKRRLGI